MTSSEIPVITTVSGLRQYRKSCYASNQKVGFIPTMGFLHDGHLSLIKKSLEQNDVTVVSIFVNPSQFAPTEDLDSYPRNIDRDVALLSSITNSKDKKVSCVFAPTVSEMYPSGIPLDVKLQKGAFVTVTGVSEQLEGSSRPSFFRGVATVVNKLFNVVQPDVAYFGQKDIQQSVVIKRMVADLLMGIEIVVGDIVRAESGLALSSRNAYLSSDSRDKAATIYKSLLLAQEAYVSDKEYNVEKLTDIVKKKLDTFPGFFDVDYISFNDVDTLAYLTNVDPKKGCILSLAVSVPNDVTFPKNGTTRLIDNVVFKPVQN
ncbi:unnamed protein product [Ambrosiozyma monospora]|uniref:Unnamed protein product n=1 Tax=Ambrosiozyma monospora TaxID=43982 RepID=A0ACB5T615_AMBMO|nr:unnamed protein product [Ambrosiozyma monospora]